LGLNSGKFRCVRDAEVGVNVLSAHFKDQLFGSPNEIAILDHLAEGVGFEPTLRFPVNTLSKRAPSATRPPLLIGRKNGHAFTKKLKRAFRTQPAAHPSQLETAGGRTESGGHYSDGLVANNPPGDPQPLISISMFYFPTLTEIRPAAQNSANLAIRARNAHTLFDLSDACHSWTGRG
jgi:hypothetical protein